VCPCVPVCWVELVLWTFVDTQKFDFVMLPQLGSFVALAAALVQVVGASDVVVERHVGSPRDVAEIGQRLHRIARSDVREFERNTTLDKSFDGATIFK
jgi:hypothetical protein